MTKEWFVGYKMMFTTIMEPGKTFIGRAMR